MDSTSVVIGCSFRIYARQPDSLTQFHAVSVTGQVFCACYVGCAVTVTKKTKKAPSVVFNL